MINMINSIIPNIRNGVMTISLSSTEVTHTLCLNEMTSVGVNLKYSQLCNVWFVIFNLVLLYCS